MSIIMDDRSDFDIWAKIKIDSAKLISNWLAERLSVSSLDAYKAVSPAVKAGRYVQIYTRYGWEALPKLLEGIPNFIIPNTAVFTEQDCSPDYDVDYCDMHMLFHQRGPCPICSGNYFRDGHRA